MKIRLLIIMILFAHYSLVLAQQTYGLKMPANQQSMSKDCIECSKIVKSIPPEVQFGLLLDGEYNIYLSISNANYFEKLFTSKNDGFAIDIVLKSQYLCGQKNEYESQVSKGDLLEPVYYKQFKDKIITAPTGEGVIAAGKLPNKYVGEEYEMNLMFIRDNEICYYTNFYDLSSSRWELLEMGLYVDTIAKINNQGEVVLNDKYNVVNKQLRFEIPFEKNKSKYSPEDIKPLYDEMRLTDYNINKISIHAYSSIEGSSEANFKLQNSRVESIVQAISGFQNKVIPQEVQVSENWVEFINDANIAGYKELTKLSKEKIKEKLNGGMAKDMEPILKNHRKAIVILELDRKNYYQEATPITILEFFNKSIEEKNITKALEIQDVIFSRIRNNTLPDDIVDDITIPKQVEYGPLLNNHVANIYQQDESDIYKAIVAYTELLDIMPNDKNIKYNICVLKLKSWLFGQGLVDKDELLADIKNLEKIGITKKHTRRLLVNYHIVLSEYYMAQQMYEEKNKALKYIYDNYKFLKLTDNDMLQLAKYFASYTKVDWAEKLLAQKVTKIDVNEDLLFYYINLTITDRQMTEKPSYRTIMLNAATLNKTRFCRMFDPYGKGGINFQLLDDEYLKNSYCENCSK